MVRASPAQPEVPLRRSRPLLLAATLLGLGACANQEIIEDGGVRVVRSACPAVAIPAETGDVTLFRQPGAANASDIDVTAYITRLRSTCGENGGQIVSTATYEVHGQRPTPGPARDVVLPTFATVIQGGTNIVAKRQSAVRLSFAEGQTRASTRAQSIGVVDRAAATLPPETVKQLTRRRRPGDADAALDPLADPAVRSAVSRASFELLVGFQLTPEQLRYNATR